MATEIALFLRDAVPQAALLPVLEKFFGLTLQSADLPNDAAQGVLTFVEYAQGFAVGIGLAFPQRTRLAARAAAQVLADRFGTEVLLEAGDGERWIVVAPGAPQPRVVQVQELRHGLQPVPCAQSLPYAARYRYA